LVAIATLGIAVGTAACAPPPTDPGDRSLSIGVPGALDVNWNPLEFGSSYWPTTQAVYDRLFMLDPVAEEYVPALAKEFELSEDGRTFSLTLRDDVDFVDGVHMNAENIAEYFTTLAGNEGTIYYYDAKKYGLVFTATGEYTLELTSELAIRDDVRFPLLANLSTTVVTSPEALKTPEVFAEGPVGSGPYLIKSQRPETITFERNPDYWNPDAYYYDEVTVTAFEDRIAAFNALKAGQIDATQIDLGMAADAEASGFDLTTKRLGFASIFFADRDGSIVPALGDVRVRQAISLALDREAINEAIQGGYGAVGTQPFIEEQVQYVEGGDEAYDLERAKDLMAEAGYADGFDLTIPTSSVTGVDDYRPVLQQSLSEIGIRVTYELEEQAFAGLADGTYALAIGYAGFSWGWQAWPEIWAGGYDDARVEALFDTADNTTSREEYEEALTEIGRIFLDEQWFAVFAQPYQIYATNDSVDIVRLDVSPLDDPGLLDYVPTN
jgi:peptide/nickel transport system substrate-binding protein